MKQGLFVLMAALLAACVPTTRYNYVPVTPENIRLAQEGEAIPLVAQDVAICRPDGETELVFKPALIDEALCPEALWYPEDYEQGACVPLAEIAGVGIPYEDTSFSIVPMAAFDLGTCDPEDLS